MKISELWAVARLSYRRLGVAAIVGAFIGAVVALFGDHSFAGGLGFMALGAAAVATAALFVFHRILSKVSV